LVPQAVVFKIRGNDKSYEEALEASVKFNKRLCSERKMRIPFIDSQTRVAQTNSMFWLSEYQRTKTVNDSIQGNVYSYPSKKWYKHRRLQFDTADSNYFAFQRHQLQQQSDTASSNGNNNANENSNSMDSFHYHSSNNNNSNTLQNKSESFQAASGSKSNSNDDYGVSNSNENEWSNPQVLQHEDSFEQFDANNDHDGGGDSGGDGADNRDGDFDDGVKRKRGGGGGGGVSVGTTKRNKPGRKRVINELNPDEKPYSCDKCGIKYKTRPGLNYHIQKAHLNPTSHSTTSHRNSNKQQQQQQQQHHHHQLQQQQQHTNADGLLNPDESTTNSVFADSVGYDDMNSSSSLPHSSIINSNHQAISFAPTNASNNYNLTNSFNNTTNSKNSLNSCGLCSLSTDAYDGSGKPNLSQADKFLACSECLKTFHPYCLKFSLNMTQSVRKYSWQCIECKKCTICGNSENDDKLLFCDDCDRGYHMYCLKPPMFEAPAGDWRCELCTKTIGSNL
jgi:zinc finger protein ubi-d4